MSGCVHLDLHVIAIQFQEIAANLHLFPKGRDQMFAEPLHLPPVIPRGMKLYLGWKSKEQKRSSSLEHMKNHCNSQCIHRKLSMPPTTAPVLPHSTIHTLLHLRLRRFNTSPTILTNLPQIHHRKHPWDGCIHRVSWQVTGERAKYLFTISV